MSVATLRIGIGTSTRPCFCRLCRQRAAQERRAVLRTTVVEVPPDPYALALAAGQADDTEEQAEARREALISVILASPLFSGISAADLQGQDLGLLEEWATRAKEAAKARDATVAPDSYQIALIKQLAATRRRRRGHRPETDRWAAAKGDDVYTSPPNSYEIALEAGR